MGNLLEQAYWAAVRSDPMVFLQQSFQTVYPGKTFVANWHIEATVHCLEQNLVGRMPRLMLNMPPRSMKSFIATIMWPAFTLGQDPSLKIVCVSYSDELAKNFSREFRRIVESEWYRRVFPHVRFKTSSEHELITDQGGRRFATSVGGTLTGRGADLIIIDDPLKPEDAGSDSARNKTNEWFRSTLLSRLDDKARSGLILVMQRLHINDLASHFQSRGDVHKLVIPAIATKTERVALRGGYFHDRRKGECLQEEVESRETLLRMRNEVGPYIFNSQYQQAPEAPEGGLFKPKYFQRISRPPPFSRNGEFFVSIDTATSTTSTANYTAITLLYVEEEKFYVIESKRDRWEFEDLLPIAIAYAELLDNFDYQFIVEAANVGVSLIQALKRRLLRCHHYPTTLDKQTRAALIVPMLVDKRLFIVDEPGKNGWVDQFINEFLVFPNGAFDDQVDSLTQVLPYAGNLHNPQSKITFIEAYR